MASASTARSAFERGVLTHLINKGGEMPFNALFESYRRVPCEQYTFFDELKCCIGIIPTFSEKRFRRALLEMLKEKLIALEYNLGTGEIDAVSVTTHGWNIHHGLDAPETDVFTPDDPVALAVGRELEKVLTRRQT